ncbi:uncharacterized protein C8A04DRAFT_14659 [Dichotomopilus funicola]|uniref:Uncharacterized protein n=1 Tax=Dichotomopilus funicola TaxID=1934379 RepID=A0AAN6UX83_9PEZI|nr:hypothetical protein C8A04DRAFT_14659 [Dichotomopilus funicola]
MPLKIDISDTAIDREEEVHQLHMWGIQTSLWKNNCMTCGRETDETQRIRCNCGEGVFCSDDCNTLRPSGNHRRAVVLHNDEPHLSLVWAEVRDDHLVIDHPSLDKCYGYPGIGASWLDLAVINPACPNDGNFRYLGHGLVMAFSSTMMDPDVTIDPKWRNKAVTDIAGPGYRNLWPGPLVFFCYGYDMSDYVKVDNLVDPADGSSSGPEVGMSKLEIWNELDSLRWEKNLFAADGEVEGWEPGRDFNKRNGHKTSERGDNFGWRWKVKDEGTSMRILDLTHRDLNVVFDYLTGSRMNAIPCLDEEPEPDYQAVLVQDANHPGYALSDLWSQYKSTAQIVANANIRSRANASSGQGEIVRFSSVDLPAGPLTLRPILGAFAVGLRWVVHFSMDINPPFRGNVSGKPHFPLLDLCWTIEHPDDDFNSPLKPTLHIPAHTFDSALIRHSEDQVPVSVHHVRALYKYLRRTDPRKWARKGHNGFENYWEVYSRVEVRDSPPGVKVPDPWAGERELDPVAQVQRSAGKVLAHMSLQGLEGETPERKAGIVKVRKKILKVIAGYRKLGIGQGYNLGK